MVKYQLLDNMANSASFALVELYKDFPSPCKRCNGMRPDDHETRDRNYGKWSKIASSLQKLVLSKLFNYSSAY